MDASNVLDYTLKAIEVVQNIATTIEQVRTLWSKQQAVIDAMTAEGRDPTIDEWKALFDLVQANSAELGKE